ncbi:MAG: RP853 family protein [Rickettsiaceae bacterium]|nr:RP853 family protein [Rickettsiaceae bacterium]
MSNKKMQKLSPNFKVFLDELKDHLGKQLDHILCNSLANLLSIDYTNRLNSTPHIKEYITICINRLHQHLGKSVVLDNDFHEAMSLFIVAITPDEESHKHNGQNALIEAIIDEFFPDIPDDDRDIIRFIILDLITGKDSKKIMNSISLNKQLFYELIVKAKDAQIEQEKMSLIVRKQFELIANQSRKLNKKVQKFKDQVGKASLALGMMAASSLGLFFGGIILPIAIVPAAILAIKLTPSIEKKITNYVIKYNKSIRQETKNLKEPQLISIQKNNGSSIAQIIEEADPQKKHSREDLLDITKNVKVKEIECKEHSAPSIKEQKKQRDRSI